MIRRNISILETTKSSLKDFNYDDFVFGVQPTDHIFLSAFKNKKWQNHRIEPFRNLSLSPNTLCLHYGQTVFEGMKAFRQENGAIHIFRPDRHHSRLNKSLDRMSMPQIPKDLFMAAIEELVRLDQQWIPRNKDISLYIRPFVIATEPRLGVKIADEYLFCITCSPMGLYYPKPVQVKIETRFIRAAEGGVGYAKCGGNYGASFYPTQKAKDEGFDQIIWTDAITKKYLEEAGTMNIMAVINNKLVTPPLSNTILDGVTRDSILQIAKDLKIETEIRRIPYEELRSEMKNGNKVELFGVGTAAVISPISRISIEAEDYFPYIEKDAIMFQLKQQLEKIRKGNIPDTHKWNHFI